MPHFRPDGPPRYPSPQNNTLTDPGTEETL